LSHSRTKKTHNQKAKKIIIEAAACVPHTYWMLPHPERFFDWPLDQTRPFCLDTRRW
jgi:hypothetical protein